jgi:hypothetical protein
MARGRQSDRPIAGQDPGFFPVATERSDDPLRNTVEPDELNPLGGATEADLSAVVGQLGADPTLEAPESLIAIECLAGAITARMAHADWADDPHRLAIFIVSDRPRQLAETLNASRAPILDNGAYVLAGRLWITSTNIASGYFHTFDATDAGGVFDEVNGLGMGEMPAMVFDPGATNPEIRYYPQGLNEDARVQRYSIGEHTFTLAALDKVLTQFHDENIITPDASLQITNPWRDGDRYIPREHTEAFIQGLLKMVLTVAFRRPYRVDFERRGTEGRCDLLISSPHLTIPNTWVSHATMELKILRSFRSTGARVSSTVRKAAVANGLLQAIAYKRQERAQDGLLCCYDMRAPAHYDGAACLDPIQARAKRNTICLRHYRVYGSSADLRGANYGSS